MKVKLYFITIINIICNKKDFTTLKLFVQDLIYIISRILLTYNKTLWYIITGIGPTVANIPSFNLYSSFIVSFYRTGHQFLKGNTPQWITYLYTGQWQNIYIIVNKKKYNTQNYLYKIMCMTLNVSFCVCEYICCRTHQFQPSDF